MGPLKMVLNVAGMLALGLAAQGGFLALTEWRMTRPLPETPLAAPEPAEAAGPVEALRAGLVGSLEAARSGLVEGRRSDAMHALDGARRAAEVGAYAAPGEAGFEAAKASIGDARRAVDVGDGKGAAEVLGLAAERLRAAGEAEGPGTVRVRVTAPIDRYVGARVIDAHGMLVGEVTGVRRDARGIEEPVVALGGHRDVAGFIDLGGRPVVVPAERVLAGAPRSVGLRMIALPFEDGVSASPRRRP
ncbi:MAG TPA: hypothetical protein VHF22_08550 [Planctomycetota bacterium]|nr:hypothetical protein [Planctomycetota bacterium]